MSATEFETLSPAAKQLALVDAAIEQIKADVEMGDFTAIEELLYHLPQVYLQGFLSEI